MAPGRGNGGLGLLLDTIPFVVPPSLSALRQPHPRSRLRLGVLPTPIHPWRPPCLERGDFAEMWIKRDDMSGGLDLGGNKVRKLEFLLADALEQGADCVVTIGGVQSNHARATAVAARMVGLDAHLVLRVADRQDPAALGLEGNLLLDRLVGSALHLVTKTEYTRVGSEALVNTCAAELRRQGRVPYSIPVGGSNALGTWGYLAAAQELLDQFGPGGMPDHIIVACGSGGTAAGIALGLRLAGHDGTRVHAMGVCDSPAYFEGKTRELAAHLGVDAEGPEPWLRFYQGKGQGYAMSTAEELATIAATARSTGVTLDPTYSGKALHAFARVVEGDPTRWAGQRVLFWHTGGVLGMFDRSTVLERKVASPVGWLLDR